MKVCTTVHKTGFEQYGHRWIESQKNWPQAEWVMYGEGFPCEKRVEDLPRLVAFKERHKDYVPPNWSHDIVRFSNKVFAAYDAFYNHEGLCVWLDADCVTYRELPEGYIEGLLPEGCYMALFQREAFHSETGFWIADGRHPEHKAFLDTWIQWFETDAFTQLRQWHDCTTLDATVKLFERDGRLRVHNLSGEYSREMHPLVLSDLGKYIDHTKGDRKGLGFSPENPHR